MFIQAYQPGPLSNDLLRTGANLAQGIPPALQRPMAMLFQSDVRRQFYEGVTSTGLPFQRLKMPRPAGGDKPLLSTGELANSYIAEASSTAIEVASRHPGAKLHQLGGTVKPVRAKALTIPLTKEAARYGSPRRFPRKLFSKWGFLVEIVGNGNKKRWVFHYAFAKKVEIPARPVGFSEKAIKEAGEMLLDYWMERV